MMKLYKLDVETKTDTCTSIAISKNGMVGGFGIPEGQAFGIYFDGQNWREITIPELQIGKIINLEAPTPVVLPLPLPLPLAVVPIETTNTAIINEAVKSCSRDCTTREFKGRMSGRRKNIADKTMTMVLAQYDNMRKKNRGNEVLEFWAPIWDVKPNTVGVWVTTHRRLLKANGV